jgi:hypothetical protein
MDEAMRTVKLDDEAEVAAADADGPASPQVVVELTMKKLAPAVFVTIVDAVVPLDQLTVEMIANTLKLNIKT